VPGRLKTFGKVAGYGFLTLLLTLYFMFLTFPYETLKDRYLPKAEAKLPFTVSIREVEASPLLWIHLSGVNISPKGKAKNPLVHVTTLKVRPALLDLLLGRPALRIKADLYDGFISGKVGRRKGETSLAFSWEDLRPEKHPYVAEVAKGAKVKGSIEGELQLTVRGANWHGGKGTFSLGLEQGSVQNAQVYGFTLPPLEGITGKGLVNLDQRKATLESLNLKSDQLSVTLDGNMNVSTRLASSRLNLKGKLKLSGQLESQYQPMIGSFLKNQDPQGFYTFSLRGTLGNPRFSF